MPSSTAPQQGGWAAGRLLPAFEQPGSLDVYDVRNAPFDVVLSAATLCGLVNRQQPRVYLVSDGDADSLREVALGDIPARRHATQAENVLEELLAEYRGSVKGLVIYDPRIIDSVNVATTLSGLRDAVVVSPQQAERLQQSPHGLPVLADLRTYAWKDRLQAYRWAARNLLRETSTHLVAGMHPGIPSGLRSYLVANRVFVYWLNPHPALPDRGNGWMTERRLMKRILRSFAPGTPHLGWFVDELRSVSMTSEAALLVVPSDYFYNLEVWSGSTAKYSQGEGDRMPTRGIPPHQEVRPSPLPALQTPKIYVSFTFSDGDNLQCSQHRLYHLWQDPARGTIPIGWTISPLLQEAAPALVEYYARTATAQDELIAGPSGAGYIHPSQWPREQLSAYLQLTGILMQRMGLTGVEVLDDSLTKIFPHRAWRAAYARSLAPFGLRGILNGDSYKRSSWRVVDGIPVIQNLGLTGSVKMALDLIAGNTPQQLTQPQYLSLYIHAWSMTPSDVKTVIQSLDERYEALTPGALLAMIARS